MKVFILLALVSVIALSRGENCALKYDCRDVGCNHHTTVTCENHICTCSAITESYRCASVGDCERHPGICNTQWKCVNKQCRCE